jgi:hypothetical protein
MSIDLRAAPQHSATLAPSKLTESRLPQEWTLLICKSTSAASPWSESCFLVRQATPPSKT